MGPVHPSRTRSSIRRIRCCYPVRCVFYALMVALLAAVLPRSKPAPATGDAQWFSVRGAAAGHALAELRA